ncbi:hypothetical protein [Flavobacterium sp. TBRC 19031]|uniref:hypothetical protein n=1 Tax=Flavobacterium mekongense TaxID=3379707 RepID=UPI003999AA13
MKNFNFEQKGGFSHTDFEAKLAEAKRSLASQYNISETEIRAVRHSQDIGISIGGAPTFPAYVVGYEIVKDEKVVGYLEGHLSKSLDYMHIFSN